jgi:hypothetical protein
MQTFLIGLLLGIVIGAIAIGFFWYLKTKGRV